MRSALLLLTTLTVACSSAGFDVAPGEADGADTSSAETSLGDSTTEDSSLPDSTTEDSSLPDSTTEDVVTAETSPIGDSGTIPETLTPPDSTAPDTTIVDSAAPDLGTPDVGPTDVGPTGCSATELPELGSVFVSGAIGNDTTGDGSALLPFKTIAKAIPVTKVRAAPRLILDQGTYNEPLVLADIDAALIVEGGWKRVGVVWTRNCDVNARSLTVIQSPAAIGVSVNNAKKRTGLAHLSVFTKAAGEAEQSLFGVMVRGTSLFFLDDVFVKAGKAGAGTAPLPAAPTAIPSCDGLTTCTNAGLTGLGGSPGAPAMKGTFVADGYVPGNGTDGAPGGSGSDGAAGGAGASSSKDECNTGCTTAGECNSTPVTTVVGMTGTCGCGGIGGKQGKAGRGGGASVALYVFGSAALVDIKGSALTSSSGGDATNGSTGAMATLPTKGAAGASAACDYGGCLGSRDACMAASTKTIAGGAAGGDGKPAGNGGNGGGGAGGPSHALVNAGGTYTLDPVTTLTSGAGGAGAGGAPAGTAGPKLVL